MTSPTDWTATSSTFSLWPATKTYILKSLLPQEERRDNINHISLKQKTFHTHILRERVSLRGWKRNVTPFDVFVCLLAFLYAFHFPWHRVWLPTEINQAAQNNPPWQRGSEERKSVEGEGMEEE